MDVVWVWVVIALAVLIVGYLCIGVVTFIIEPIYMLLFKKPVYVYFYPRIRKLTAPQKRILEQQVPFYRRLPQKKQTYFEHRLSSFLRTYDFHGQENMQITDQMKVLVAATYVMLTFGIREYLIATFNKIIIYPGTYHSTINDTLHNGEFNPRHAAIVFSWEHFQKGLDSAADNINLGIHEFAHALHYHGMKKRENSAALFARMYNEVIAEVKQPEIAAQLTASGYFRSYAFANEFEFLAVILEHFFETPETFKQRFPVLFLKVQRMINFDPLRV